MRIRLSVSRKPRMKREIAPLEPEPSWLVANLASWAFAWSRVLWQRLQFSSGRSTVAITKHFARNTFASETHWDSIGSQATNSISLSSLHTDIFVNLICAICCQTTSSTIYKCGPATGCPSAAHTHIPGRRLLCVARTTDDKDGIDDIEAS